MRRTIAALAACLTVAPALGGQEVDPRLALAAPGPEHETLMELTGTWQATLPTLEHGANAVAATVRPSLGGRFLDIRITGADSIGSTATQILLGFDRRNATHQMVLMDNWGTYLVFAQGTDPADPTLMHGTDPDPVMRKMGIEKAFTFRFVPEGRDRFAIEVAWIDNRGPDPRAIPAGAYRFERRP